MNLRCRAYQLAADPESAATMALAGRRVESSQTRRCGLTNPVPVAVGHGLALHGLPPVRHVLFDRLAPRPVGLALEQGQQRPQRGGGVGDQVQLVG